VPISGIQLSDWLHRKAHVVLDKHTVSAMLLREILDIAISITGADKGNVQLFTPETRALTIAAQRGFDAIPKIL
jgi:hypothetical protein